MKQHKQLELAAKFGMLFSSFKMKLDIEPVDLSFIVRYTLRPLRDVEGVNNVWASVYNQIYYEFNNEET